MKTVHLITHDYGLYQSTFAFCGKEIFGEVGENKTNRLDKTTCYKCRDEYKKRMDQLVDKGE